MGHQATYAGDAAKSLILIELAALDLNQLVLFGMLMTINGRTCLPSWRNITKNMRTVWFYNAHYKEDRSLGRWVNTERSATKQHDKLGSERISTRLESIGFVWWVWDRHALSWYYTWVSDTFTTAARKKQWTILGSEWILISM
jgi:hypothetical protein